jgi:hypothetical protein
MTSTQFGADEATALRAEQVVEELVGVLDSLASGGSIVAVPVTSSRVFIVAYGWWAYITRSSQAVLTLRRANLDTKLLL